MPKTIQLETDPAEIAEMLAKDKGCSDAITKLVKSSLSGAKMRIPATTVDGIRTEVEKSLSAKADPHAIADALLEGLTKPVTAAKTPAAKATAKATRAKGISKTIAKGKADKSKNRIHRNCWKYAAPGLELKDGKWFIVYRGDPGTSKTYSARTFAASAGFDHVVEVGCLKDMEAKDFIAGACVKGDGTDGFLYVDGPLAKAWRLAAAGKTVCIILDEIGNVPRGAKQAFQTATSPDMHYNLTLSTGRAITPKGREAYIEEITAPMAMISIIGTQNIGPKFDCPPDSPAFKARFKPFYVKTDESLIRAVVGGRVDELKWGKPITDAFVRLWKESIKAQDKSLLDTTPNIREFLHFCNACSDASPSDAMKALGNEMVDDGNKEWFVAEGHNGAPMTDQMETWSEVVRKHFPA